MIKLIDKLEKTTTLTKDEYIKLIKNRTPGLSEYLFKKADAVRKNIYGKDVYIRGLIEI